MKIQTIFFICILTLPLFASDEDPLYFFKKAENYRKDNKSKDAYSNYEQFLKHGPYEYEVREALFRMAEIHFQNQNYFDSITYCNRMLKTYKTSKYHSETRLLLGKAYYHIGLLREANETLAEVAKTHLKNPYILYQSKFYLGKISFKEKKFRKSAGEFTQALASYRKEFHEVDNLDLLAEEAIGVYLKLRMVPEAYRALKSFSPKFRLTKKFSLLKKHVMNSYLREEDGLPEQTITSIKIDGDDIWIGTFISGVIRFTRSSGKFSLFSSKEGLISNEVRDILPDGNKVWISTLDGVSIYNKKSSEFSMHTKMKEDKNFRTQRICLDDRNLYFGTLGGGVKVLDKISGEYSILGKKSPLGSDLVPSIRSDDDRVVFSTLGNGLVVLERKTGGYTVFNKKNGLSGDDVRDALPDGRFIWAGIHGKGINKIDIKNKTIEHLTEKGNLAPVYPTCLAKRGSEIWVGTLDSGIRIYRQDSQTWEKYTVLDGLSSNDINHIEIEGDYIWVGTLDKGITIIYYPQEYNKE